jgi:hypothetical protein
MGEMRNTTTIRDPRPGGLPASPIMVVTAQFGHADLDSTQRYTRLTDAERRAAVARAEF